VNRAVAWAGFSLAWLACLVALAPMRWLGEFDAWRNAGLSASGASGTIWNGRLLGLKAGTHGIGDVDAGVSALAALGGTAAISFAARDGRGELLLGRERGLRDASGDWPLALRTRHGPLRLSLSLDGVSAVFRDGRCVEAAGDLAAQITVAAAGSQAPRLALSGSPTCREGVVEARLLPAPGSPAVDLLVQAKSDGHYRLTWVARAPDPALQAALALAGFTAAPEGLSRIDEGRLAGPGVHQP
jgi:hypothetical protein